MKRAIVAGLAVVALGCGATSAPGKSSAPTASPTIKLLDRSPLTIRGLGFRARESVRVTATGRSRRTRATSGGTFVLVLGSAVDRCNAVRVLAVGGSGSRAILKIGPSPMCAPLRSR